MNLEQEIDKHKKLLFKKITITLVDTYQHFEETCKLHLQGTTVI
jgi:hypothetical protein